MIDTGIGAYSAPICMYQYGIISLKYYANDIFIIMYWDKVFCLCVYTLHVILALDLPMKTTFW